MNIEIKLDTSRLDRIISDFPAAMKRAQHNALAAIGEEAESQATRAFRNKTYRPSPWQPRKETYITVRNKQTGKAVIDRKTGKKKRKLDTHPLLIKSGKMRQGISSKIISTDTVAVGSDMDYAKFHQFGTKHMPPRPFFPVDQRGNLTPRFERKVKRIIKDAFTDEINKVLGH